MNEAARLYIIATPIGNMEDITLRALRILGEVDVVAAEDTRVTGKLLSRHGISKPMISLNQHNEASRARLIIERIQAGESVALCSDAGTPALSDPGARLVGECRQAGVECVPIPGASALAAAISVAGLDSPRFAFDGFLPSAGAERRRLLEQLEGERRNIVLYEAPHRLGKTLADLLARLGDRRLTIARELTKLHEEVLTCRISEAMEKFAQPRGEFVLIIHPGDEEAQPDMEAAAEQMAQLLAQGMARKAAAAHVANQFGISKNAAYSLGLKDDGNNEG